MWYFAWILGLPLAVCFAVLNAMWFEMLEDSDSGDGSDIPAPRP
ncbi:cyd operon protein YbgT [Paracoccus halophilus]|uniref:Cyd operon protein YbgT n=1 Tax=Paracoccus halophilus TaxID=376733 RepID=A0A1I0SVL9_9RHOB|nr:cytochrome bd-I oxidase subunit CydX [Paracoccus halophilus]SFA43521.1 cyd operon protein YbgT [Paracoccus halophilus]